MAPRVGRKPIPEKLAQTKTTDGVLQGVQPKIQVGSGRTVTVACKAPTGLNLRIFKWIDDRGSKPAHDGTRDKISVEDNRYKRIRVNGPSRYYFPGPAPDFAISGGYALTPNVDRDFMELWMEQNKESELVVNKLIFIMPTEREAVQAAQDLREIKSGFEPLDIDEKPKGLSGKGNLGIGTAKDEMDSVKKSGEAA